MTPGDTIYWTEEIAGRRYARIGTVAARRGANVRTAEGNMRKVADVVTLPHRPEDWPRMAGPCQALAMFEQLPEPQALALLAGAGIRLSDSQTLDIDAIV